MWLRAEEEQAWLTARQTHRPRGKGNLLERNLQVVLGPDSGKDPGTVGQALFKYLAEGQAY